MKTLATPQMTALSISSTWSELDHVGGMGVKGFVRTGRLQLEVRWLDAPFASQSAKGVPTWSDLLAMS